MNDEFSDAGGCQTRVQPGDSVLWVFSAYQQPLLRLSGAPARAATGEAFSVTVDQNDGGAHFAPAVGADVVGSTTGTDGKATISFGSPGVKRFKATRADAVRSNAAEVCVYVPDSGECGTTKPGEPPPAPPAAPAAKDTTPPTVVLSLRDGGTYTRGPRLIAGSADDASGLWGVYLRVSKVESGAAATRCRWFSGRLERFTRSRPCARARFVRLGREAKWSYLLPERLEEGQLRGGGEGARPQPQQGRREGGVQGAMSAALVALALATAPVVTQNVVYRDGEVRADTARASAVTVTVSGRSCAVPAATPLAALVRSRVPRVRLRDFGSCSRRAADAEAVRLGHRARSQPWQRRLGVQGGHQARHRRRRRPPPVRSAAAACAAAA